MSLLLKKKCCCGSVPSDPDCCRIGNVCVPVQLYGDCENFGSSRYATCRLRAEAVDLSAIGGHASVQILTDVSFSGFGCLRKVTVTGSPTGGTFTLNVGGYTTGPIAYNASAATLKSAIDAVTVGLGTASTTGAAGGPWTVGFAHSAGSVGIGIAGNSLTGGSSPSVAVEELSEPTAIWSTWDSPSCGTWQTPILRRSSNFVPYWFRASVTLTQTSVAPFQATATMVFSLNADLSAPFLTLTSGTFDVYTNFMTTWGGAGFVPARTCSEQYFYAPSITWSNGSSGKALVMLDRCCDSEGGCLDQVNGKLIDPAGRMCCEFRYAVVVEVCDYDGAEVVTPLPGGPYVVDLVTLASRLGVAVGETNGTAWLMDFGSGRRRAVYHYQQDLYCVVPSGFTLMTLPDPIHTVDFNFGGSHQPNGWLCIGYSFCNEAGELVASRSFTIAPEVQIQNVHTLWSGCSWACSGGGADPRAAWDGVMQSSGDAGGYSFKTAFTPSGSFTSEQQKISGLECRCYWLQLTLFSQCGYWQEVGWDEETYEPIYEWVPPAHYWELLVMLSEVGDCGGEWGVIWAGRKAFDPTDPTGAAGTYAYTSTGYYDYYFNPLPSTPLCGGPATITVTEVI